MTSKPPESDDAAGPSSAVHGSTAPSSSAEPGAAVTRTLADAMGGVASSPDAGGQKGVEDGAKTPRNSGRRRDKSESVEPPEPPVDR